MNDQDKILRRLHSLFKKLGDYPKCVVCGHDNPFGLELHNVAGHSDCDQTVIVCRRCRHELRKRQKLRPEPNGGLASDLERSARYLLGRADICDLFAERLRCTARTLFEFDQQAVSAEKGGTSQ
jgi:hypothetical protein